jgi:hypothetical protein
MAIEPDVAATPDPGSALRPDARAADREMQLE